MRRRILGILGIKEGKKKRWEGSWVRGEMRLIRSEGMRGMSLANKRGVKGFLLKEAW